MSDKRPFDTLPRAQQAGILCQQDQFRDYLYSEHGHPFHEDAAPFIRAHCGVLSRRDLDTNEIARDRFDRLRTSFDAWRGKIGTP